MGNKAILISEFLKLKENHLIIDVRSPAEFEKGHIPDALSVPIFNNEERAIIGTLYKREGRRPAMLEALNYYGPNIKRIVAQVIELTNETNTSQSKDVLVYCWRGGMRSGVVCWMLNLFGINTYQLIHGYKAYRQFVLKSFQLPFQIKILGGKTGSAKTDLLNAMKKSSFQCVDLENLALHRGSAFGGLGQTHKPTQEQFENDLCDALTQVKADIPIWMEDESQRIGNVNIPNALWHAMRSADLYYLEIPLEARLEQIVKNYGQYDVEDLISCTERLQKRLGHQQTMVCIQHLRAGEIEAAFKILLHYYDKTYQHSTDKRNTGKIYRIASNTVDINTNLKLIQSNLYGQSLKTNEV